MDTNILVTDIVGYSKITGDDQKLALELLKEHDNIIEPIINRYDGIIVKRIGDAIIATYSSSNKMIQSSIEIQQHLKNRNNRNIQNRHIVLRIGLHYGKVTMQNEELYGDGYDIASKIEPICKYGGISISEPLYKKAHHHNHLIVKGIKNHFFVRPVAYFTFHNSSEPILIYNLYLNLLDWYEDIFNKTHLYLSNQGISKNMYKAYNLFPNFSFDKSFPKANKFYNNNNLSYAVYHYKMCIDYGNKNNSDYIHLLILKIFSECGLHRLVNRVIKKLNFDDNSLLYIIKGICLFNQDKWDKSTDFFHKALDENIDENIIDSVYYLIIIYSSRDINKTINFINKLLPEIKSSSHKTILRLVNDILSSSNDIIEDILNKFENQNLYNTTHHKYLLFIYLVILRLYIDSKQTDKALIIQNKARNRINFLSEKISGFQLKKIFIKNPMLHKILLEAVDVDFIEDIDGIDGIDINIEDLLESKKVKHQFCTECGNKNNNNNKFCTECGANLL